MDYYEVECLIDHEIKARIALNILVDYNDFQRLTERVNEICRILDIPV